MSDAARVYEPDLADVSWAEPYDTALRDGDAGLLLREARAARPVGVLDVARFTAAADDTDRTVLARGAGPVVDLGCGPGRMVLAAIQAGRIAMGVDVSPAAVRIARDAGLPVLRRSVFATLPGERAWGQVLLLDGNIGIGGDGAGLLARTATLVAEHGIVTVEAHPDRTHERSYEAVLVGRDGVSSEPFPWAEYGARSIERLANRAGLRVSAEWAAGSRTFVELQAAH